ncbi:hypothetical protein Ct61P_07150 [Colletotrichum tofieldiae]|nr:hypothetical protein Ct61P_07150 [Colletotrichum tofieldiae]
MAKFAMVRLLDIKLPAFPRVGSLAARVVSWFGFPAATVVDVRGIVQAGTIMAGATRSQSASRKNLLSRLEARQSLSGYQDGWVLDLDRVVVHQIESRSKVQSDALDRMDGVGKW